MQIRDKRSYPFILSMSGAKTCRDLLGQFIEKQLSEAELASSCVRGSNEVNALNVPEMSI